MNSLDFLTKLPQLEYLDMSRWPSFAARDLPIGAFRALKGLNVMESFSSGVDLDEFVLSLGNSLEELDIHSIQFDLAMLPKLRILRLVYLNSFRVLLPLADQLESLTFAYLLDSTITAETVAILGQMRAWTKMELSPY